MKNLILPILMILVTANVKEMMQSINPLIKQTLQVKLAKQEEPEELESSIKVKPLTHRSLDILPSSLLS